MTQLKLNFACALYDRMIPLQTGAVRPEGVDLNFLVIDDAREIFDRMAGGQEFHASEFSCAEYISRWSAGQCPFVAIPAFPLRVFRHSFICVNRKSNIRAPKDLEGKRVGVPLYTMSAAIWIRGHLQHDYGVDLSRISWVQGAVNSGGTHGTPTVMPLLRPVQIEQNRTGKPLSQLLAEGEIDAIIGGILPDSLKTSADVVRLFPNFREVEREYFKRTRIHPIMHLVAIRKDVYERDPFVATTLFNALNDSKRRAMALMRELHAPRYMLPWMNDDIDEAEAVFGHDFWPYGIEPNRPTLEALVRYLADQALISAPMPIEKLFVPINGQA